MMMAPDLAALGTSLALLHDASLVPAQRKRAEEALLAFQASDAAWGVCLSILCPPVLAAGAQQQQQQQQRQQPDLELFAAQTLRAKVNAGGAQLQQHQLEALRDQLLRCLAAPAAGAPLLRQLALALCSVVALLHGWNGIVGAVVSAQLPAQHAVELLRLLAEEGASDWRHITLPGLSSSQHLDWASATRERFRSWSPAALGLLHGWLQQHAGDTQARVLLLACMTGWVRLGALHQVRSSELAHQTAQAGLACIQSCNEQEVAAGLSLLLELPEYSPEPLIRSLQPAMIAMAQSAASLAAAGAPAAAAAAAGAASLARARVWVQAFAAHAMACPQRLLVSANDTPDWTLRDALLQLSILPQVHEGQLLCLPALEVWGTLLDADLASWASGGACASAGSSRQLPALQDGDADTDGEAAGDACRLPDAFVRSCQQLLLQTASNYITWMRSADGRQALADEAVAAAVSDVLQLCCQALGAQAYLTAITQFVWSGPGSIPAPSAPLAALLDVPELEPLPAWQQQQLQAAVASIASAPEQLRLFAAVLMAAAVHSTPAAADSAAAEQQGQDALWSNPCNVEAQAAGIITQLLSNAASAMQQLAASGGMADLQLPQLVTHFCAAVKAWAVQLVRHFKASAGGMQALHGLLGLLLSVAAHGEEAAAAAAGAGMRAVVTAAVEEGCQLHEFAWPLMQAVQSLPCAGTTEQDLLASLSGCLAAAGADQQELQQLRSAVAQQLVLPAVAALEAVLQQLHAAAWPAIAAAADAALCHHLMRVRAVLEGRLLQQQRAHLQQQSDAAVQAQAAAGACPGSEEGRSPRAVDRGAAGMLADQLADAAMDEDVRAAGAAVLQLQALQLTGRADSSSSRVLAGLAADPAIQLLLEQLLPSLNTLISQQPAAAGKFVTHHAKCCTRLLRLHPGLLLPQLPQLLQAAVAAMPRPGGSALAEPFAAAIEMSCRHGSGLLLDSSHHITQAMGQLWAAPDVAALARPGAGDERPDLAEPVLKLTAAFIKHSRSLQPSGVAVTVAEAALLAAAACAGCAHAKVAGTSLGLLAAVLAAAGTAGPQQQQLLAVVARHGPRAGGGVFAALLAPSPLPRLSKAAAALTELAAAAQQLQAHSEAPAAPDEQLLHAWLLQAASALLGGDEAAALARDCGGILASGIRSYVACRRLKRRLRDLAEAHMRPVGSAGGN